MSNLTDYLPNHPENSLFEHALARCFEIYQLPCHEIIPHFMTLLTEFYQCNRAYVQSIDYEKSQVSCIAHWNENNSSENYTRTDGGEKVLRLINWIKTYAENGFLVCDMEQEHSTEIHDIFKPFQIKNVTFATIENTSKEIVGIVGISNRPNLDNHDLRLLKVISKFVAQDVSQGFANAKLMELHYNDLLTGLRNRTGYAKGVDLLLAQKTASLGVIAANINGLKAVNEEFGIAGGDEYIKKSAQRMKAHFDFEIFRMSGDEFVGLAPNVDKNLFESSVQALQKNMKEEGNFDFSLGHAWAEGKLDMTKLNFEAETRMYINKQEYYSISEHKFEGSSDTVLATLLTALDEEEFMIYLQPQVKLVDGSLYGAEALIRRFDKRSNKMVFPDQFIPLYEQKSIIRHVDMFVVDAVCQLLKKWDVEAKGIPISVNLSRVTLLEHGIVETIVNICDKYQVPHELLVIEVTERVGLIENNVASSLVKEFKENGFNISLDDFGCAYSNIVTLAQIRVDEVKIDKSLVDNLTTNKNNHILVKNVLTMCNELDGASTLAEGIEDEEQARLLHELGCHLGQGYFYSRPIPVPEFEEKYLSF